LRWFSIGYWQPFGRTNTLSAYCQFEKTMSPISIAILAGLAGLVVGSLITAWLMRRPSNPTSPSALQEELECYREQVADHFADTAALVNRMTDSYKEVFDHLESGATKLIDEERLKQKLLDQSDETITLNRLGSPTSAVDPDSATTPHETVHGEAQQDSDNESEPTTEIKPPPAAHS